ncbi:MAG: hypothetical protein AAF710_01440 [Planctomycetota bacterium]
MTAHSPALPIDTPPPARSFSPYGRARLWLGMTNVGFWVAAASAALAFGVPAEVFGTGNGLALAGFVAVYAVIQSPFDWLGGYVFPRRHGRDHPPIGRYAATWLRGVAVHGLSLWAIASGLYAASAYGGRVGLVAAAFASGLVLLAIRPRLARLTARFRVEKNTKDSGLPLEIWRSDDEGFTGGVAGWPRASHVVLPARWRQTLGETGFAAAQRRRELAVSSGAWVGGRVTAGGFSLAGFAASAALVRPESLGHAAGVTEFGLWFTLWSFLGLLTLPTVSRRAVVALDRLEVASASEDPGRDARLRGLDALQDDEPRRPRLIETIFHPLPGVASRLDHSGGEAGGPRRPGGWDAARTNVFLSWSGLSLLSRAVHCNCGRPALWVFLPTD